MFSVIIPAYNEERYIEKTLTSLPENVEVIVVCNGCTDNTFKISKKYTKQVYNIKQKNVSLARNYGAIKASKENLIFLDADTILTKNTFDEIKNAFNDNIVGTCNVKPNNPSLVTLLFTSIKNSFPRFKIHNSSGIIFCSKNVFNKINGFNNKITKGENGDFIKRAKKHAKFVFVKAYVTTSMRRFEKFGYFNVIIYWLLERLKLNKKEYPAVR